MPEGHTLHRAALDQRPLLVGHALRLTAPDGRCTDVAKRLDRRVLVAVTAVGKHLFYRFDGPQPNVVHVHLALLGSFRVVTPDAEDGTLPEPRGAVRLRLDRGDLAVDVHAALVAELLDVEAEHALLARLGPDPLATYTKPGFPKPAKTLDLLATLTDVGRHAGVRGVDRDRAYARIARSRQAIGTLLMDQSAVSGIGNIYRAELLFRHKLHPLTPARDVPHDLFARLWFDACALLGDGVRRERILTITPDDARRLHGRTLSRLSRRQGWYIYKKDVCPLTGGPVEVATLAGRECWWSPAYQTTGGQA